MHVDAPERSADRAHAGHVDDRAAASSLLHTQNGLARAQECAAQCHSLHSVPLLHGHVEEFGFRAMGSIVDQDVHASEPGVDGCEQRCH
jgi:hypothetical protein